MQKACSLLRRRTKVRQEWRARLKNTHKNEIRKNFYQKHFFNLRKNAKVKKTISVYFCSALNTEAPVVLFFVFLFVLNSPKIGHATDWQLRAVIMGLSPPPGTPPTALSLRKYHYHRYLSSLPASSNLAAVPKSNTLGKSRGHRSAFLWLAGSSPRNNGNVSVEGIFNCQWSWEIFIPSLSSHGKRVYRGFLKKYFLIFSSAFL